MAQTWKPSKSLKFRNLWESQNGICAICKRQMPQIRPEVMHATIWRKMRPTIDHIVPTSKGGSDRIDNLQLVHARCNKRRGNDEGRSFERRRYRP